MYIGILIRIVLRVWDRLSLSHYFSSTSGRSSEKRFFCNYYHMNDISALVHVVYNIINYWLL